MGSSTGLGEAAANLVMRGFAVTGFDVRTEAMVRAGGKGAQSAADAAAGADVLVLMVVNAEQADALFFS